MATKTGVDKYYGGMEKKEEQIQLFETERTLWADASGREILSLVDFDPTTNTLIVRNTPTNLDMVEVFLDYLDREPRQVSIETKFITYSMTEAEKVGIDVTFGGVNAAGEFVDTAEFSGDSVSDGSLFSIRLDTNIDE